MTPVSNRGSSPEASQPTNKPPLSPNPGDFQWHETHPVITVPCKHCNGTGSVDDVSQWPPKAPCPGCKGAGVHLLTTKTEQM